MRQRALATAALALAFVATTLVAIGGDAPPASATTTTYTASTGFSGTQGQNQWSYQKLSGATYSNLASYNSGAARWQESSGYPWVAGNQVHPDNTFAAVRKWTAPGNGTIAITGAVSKGDALGDGIVASVRKNSTSLWSATVTNTSGVTPTGVGSIAVATGDAIYFVVDKNGSMSNDHTFWNPVVTFTTGSPPPPPTGPVYQAEAGTFGGGQLGAIQTASAAVGGQVVGALNNTGAFSQVASVNGGTGGTGSIEVRYSNGYGTSRSLSLYVNGVDVQQLVFPPTGGWNTFQTLTANPVTLTSGNTNVIRLQRDGSDVAAADIDQYTVTPNTGGGGGPGTQPANSLSVTAFGAVANDAGDDLAAFNATVTAAQNQGKSVWVPAGTFRLSGLWTVTSVQVSGAGMTHTTLLSTNPAAGAIYLKGTSPALRFLKHEYATVNQRDGNDNKNSISVYDATGFVIEGVWVYKATCGGILSRNSSSGLITGNKVEDTNADQIHVTDRSHHVTVSNNTGINTLTNAGDDMIAVVSYSGDSGTTHHITIENNNVSGGHARGISVVGGEDITITGNTVKDSQMASSYIAVEHNAQFNTRDVFRVTLTGNVFEHGGIRTPHNHPNVLVFSDVGGVIDEVTYTNNQFKDAAHDGVGVRGSGNIQDIWFTGNILTGTAGNPTQFTAGIIHLSGNTGF